MRTAMDSAGRLVVPEALREAMRLSPGQELEIVYTDGRLEIEIAPAPVRVVDDHGWPVLQPEGQLPQLAGGTVRQVLEDTRR